MIYGYSLLDLFCGFGFIVGACAAFFGLFRMVFLGAHNWIEDSIYIDQLIDYGFDQETAKRIAKQGITSEELDEYREKFYLLATKAIQEGLLTPEERDLISRVGTRKEGYWSRHYRDLVEWLKYKRRS